MKKKPTLIVFNGWIKRNGKIYKVQTLSGWPILMSNEVNFKIRNIARSKRRHFVIIEEYIIKGT